MSNFCQPCIICSLIFKKWHGFCRTRICRLGLDTEYPPVCRSQFLHHSYTFTQNFYIVPAPLGMVLFCLLEGPHGPVGNNFYLFRVLYFLGLVRSPMREGALPCLPFSALYHSLQGLSVHINSR